MDIKAVVMKFGLKRRTTIFFKKMAFTIKWALNCPTKVDAVFLIA